MGRQDYETETLIAHSLRGEGFDASEDGTGRGTPLVPVAYQTFGDGAAYETGEITAPLRTGTDNSASVVAFAPEISATIAARSSRGGGQTNSPGHNADQHVVVTSAVRRLTPRECERLQGFPDHFTLVPHRGKPMADGPRYKMLGNSMAVPVLRWIGERIQMADALASLEEAA